MTPDRALLFHQSDGRDLLAELHEEQIAHGRTLRRLDALALACERFMQMHDALENPRPAAQWFALKDALKAIREESEEEPIAPDGVLPWLGGFDDDGAHS